MGVREIFFISLFIFLFSSAAAAKCKLPPARREGQLVSPPKRRGVFSRAGLSAEEVLFPVIFL